MYHVPLYQTVPERPLPGSKYTIHIQFLYSLMCQPRRSMRVCVCMHACKHVRVCMYMPGHTCICIYVCMYVCMYACVCVCVCVSLCLCVHAGVCVHTYVCMCLCMYVLLRPLSNNTKASHQCVNCLII